MATCKDCIHYEVCKTEKGSTVFYREGLLESTYNQVDKLCGALFKDKFRFVELPCRVGDKVYCGSFGKLMEDEIICITIDANETRMVLKRGFSFDIDMINKMFFFTGEEAEQMLKERGNCNNTD